MEDKTYSTDAWQEWYGDKTHGTCVNSGEYDGLDYEAAVDAIAADLAAIGLGEKKSSGACATGASRASATGAARFPSSTANHAATCRYRTRSCR